MANKEIKITVPEGYEIDKENSTFECIKFKKKVLTYRDVAKELFCGKAVHYISTDGCIKNQRAILAFTEANNATNYLQLARLLAYNKLMNVAEYLNQGRPFEHGYHYIYIDRNGDIAVYNTDCKFTMRDGQVFFISYEAAKQAIEILGEDTVKTALGVFK